ncbi:MAG: SRPBCC family protein [Archangium sp.]|nr:SRPBCC family protein [Archangium sp.]
MRFLCLSLIASAAALAQPLTLPTFTEAEAKKLDAGETVIHEVKPTGNKGIGVESFGVIDAPSTEVWPVLRDCEHFASFMPRMKSSSLKQEEGATLCHVELNLPFPLMNLWSDTKSVQREDPAGHYHRAWTLVRGSYRRNSGSWSVLPWGDGKKTLVIYAIDSDPIILIPDGILRSAQTGSLPEVFQSIRKRVVAVRSP